jgi:hypothetical protein
MFVTIIFWFFLLILTLSGINYGITGLNQDWDLLVMIKNMTLRKVIYFIIAASAVIVFLLFMLKKNDVCGILDTTTSVQ